MYEAGLQSHNFFVHAERSRFRSAEMRGQRSKALTPDSILMNSSEGEVRASLQIVRPVE
jgi:hypothetical protein